MQYYVLFGEQQTGPFSIDQINGMIARQEIRRDTRIRREEDGDWNEAGWMEDLEFIWDTDTKENEKIGSDKEEHTDQQIDGTENAVVEKQGIQRFFCDFRYWGNILGMIGAAAALVSLFLPYVSIQIFGTKMNMTMIRGDDGKIFLVLIIVLMVTAVLRSRIAFLLASILMFVLQFVEYQLMMKKAAEGEWDISALISKEEGFYLMVLSSVCLLVSSLVRLRKKHFPIPAVREEEKKDAEVIQKTNMNARKKWIIAVPVICGIAVVSMIVYFVFFYLSEEDKAAVQYATQAIDEIGTVSLQSGFALVAAETAYAKLEPRAQRFVKNRELLDNARDEYYRLRTDEVSNRINAIGELTVDKISLIESAQAAYDSLYDIEKQRVANVDVLNTAIEKLPELKAIDQSTEMVNEFMDALKTASTYRLSSMITSDSSDGAAMLLLCDKDMYAIMLWGSWGIVEGVSLSSMDVLTQLAVQNLAYAAIKHYVIDYSILGATYEGDIVKVEVSAKAPLKDITTLLSSKSIADSYFEKGKEYVNNNRTSIGLLAYSMSDVEIAKYIIMMTLPDYLSDYESLINADALYTGTSSKTITFTMKEESGMWKIYEIDGLF